MKLSTTELVVVGLLIVYVAFFTHPPPSHIKDFLGSPVGHALFLATVLWVAAYKSLIVGVFMGIAYIMTAKSVTEYLDPTEQKPAAKKPAQPKSSAVPEPVVADLIKDIMQKGDKPAHHAKAGKSVTAPPPATQDPKPATASSTVEKFASY
uniref:Uncharacterized protein n=1 Tax=viral metagenome TaxID=1070528 RepID=A0A6C0F2T4_9ZZZZ